MEINKISIKNFKALYDVDFEPGRVNVFVGTNGVGKTSLLESIGILRYAINEQVEDESLYRRGVRLGTPNVYKTSLESFGRKPHYIELAVDWTDEIQLSASASPLIVAIDTIIPYHHFT